MENLLKHPIVKGYIQANNFGRLLKMDFKILSAGHVVYEMTITNDHLATPIAAHGGSITALMDATMGVCALSNVIEQNRVVSTIDLKISFVKPARPGDLLSGKADILNDGRTLLFVEGEIRNQNDDLIAFATGTFNSYPAEKIGF